MATVERRDKSRLEYGKNTTSPSKSPFFSVTTGSPMGPNIAERAKAFSGSSPLASKSSAQLSSKVVTRIDSNRPSTMMSSPLVQDTALCPVNIVATRRQLFTPGSTHQDYVQKKVDSGAQGEKIRASSPTSDKENSAKCDMSNRTKSCMTSVTKCISFDYLCMDEKKEAVKDKALDNGDSSLEPSDITDHELAKNPRSLFEERKRWLQGKVTCTNSFTESEGERKDGPKANSNNVPATRTMWLQKQVSTNSIVPTGPVERAVSAPRLRMSERFPPKQVQSISLQNPGDSRVIQHKIRARSPSSEKENSAKRDVPNNIKTNEITSLTLVDAAPKGIVKGKALDKRDSSQEPRDITDHELAKNPRSLFEERKRWLQGRVTCANSFTESEGERNDEPKANSHNVAATRTMWLQKQVSTNSIVSTGHVERAVSAPRLRMSDPLPPAQVNSIFRQNRLPPVGLEPRIPPCYSFNQESRGISRLKKKKSEKATTLVASRAYWLQNQVRKNQFFEDIPSSDEGEEEKPKTDIQLRLEALQKEMTVEKPMATLGVPPKRNWADLP